MDAENSLSLEQWGLEKLFNINELADYLRVPASTIYEWRAKGRAPRAHHRVDRTLFAVVIEAYVHGVSTRKVDDLVKALGGDAAGTRNTAERHCRVARPEHQEAGLRLVAAASATLVLAPGDPLR